MGSDIVSMSSFEYAVTHQHDPREVSEVLVELGFEGGTNGRYRRGVDDDWEDITAFVRDDEVLLSMYWPGTRVTSRFYEYLFACGILAHKIQVGIAELTPLMDRDD